MEQNLYFDGAKSIRLTQLGTISSGQDGAISNGYIFRFDQAGLCRVFLPVYIRENCGIYAGKSGSIGPPQQFRLLRPQPLGRR